jgi:hypothetical protein
MPTKLPADLLGVELRGQKVRDPVVRRLACNATRRLLVKSLQSVLSVGKGWGERRVDCLLFPFPLLPSAVTGSTGTADLWDVPSQRLKHAAMDVSLR